MPEYQLYCFAQSGNAYRAALMLNLIGADWKPVFVDFFKGETRTPQYRGEVNEMGEAPVLAHGDRKLSQSGVILTYLARRSRQVSAAGRGRGARGDALDHLRQPEGQRLPRAVSVPEELRQARRRSGGARLLQGPHRRQSRHRQQAAGKARRSCSATGRPSRTCRSPAISIIRSRNSASTSARTIRRSRPGASGCRRCRAGSIPYDLMPGHPLPG